jgi:YlmC/YmxH family sporulation protein
MVSESLLSAYISNEKRRGGFFMRIYDLKQKEVINVKDCKRLGFVGDVDFDIRTGSMVALIVPGPGCICGFLGREKEYVIPFGDICQIGDDIILVELKERKTEGK